MSKSRRRSQLFALTSDCIDELEDNLVRGDKVGQLDQSFKEMEQLFIQHKVLNQLADQEREKTNLAKENLQATKKRLSQIKNLDRVVKKQTSLMRTEAEKIKDALTMNKILVMERLLRMQRETEDLHRKRQLCQRIKTEKQMLQQRKKVIMGERLERVRLESLNNTINIKQGLEEVRCNTMEMKRIQVEQIKSAHERQRSKSRKIQSFKQERAKLNYLSKVEEMKQEINDKQEALEKMHQIEVSQEVKTDSTIKVTDEYLQSFFPTQDISL